MRHQRKLAVGVLAVLSILLSLRDEPAFAAGAAGVLTQSEGDVKVFSHPSKTLQKGEGIHALYEGEYYLVETARVGAPVEQGNIVRTAPGGKARIVYSNGDQINVGPASAMRVFLAGGATDGNTRIDLAYGKLRGVIEKGGPRGKLQIRTRTATMGVRGTDFFIADDGKDGGTEISVLRGAVEVAPRSSASAKGSGTAQPPEKPIEIRQGFSAEIPVSSPSMRTGSAAVAIEPRKTTQEELQGIQKSSTVERSAAPVEPAAAATIAQLEKKAVETTLKDIKTHDPKLYAQLETQKVSSTDELNGRVVKQLLQEAPHAPSMRKPFKAEIDDLERGAYEKYFKSQE